MKIIELSHSPALIDQAVDYFWNCWGNETNHIFYKNCIIHSLEKANSLPKFYLALEGEQIIGSYALLTNDIISRQDLMPWFACLFVNEEKRNQGLGGRLLEHGLQEARSKGFDHLYLSTDLMSFYENRGWKHICEGYGVFGDEFKVYSKET